MPEGNNLKEIYQNARRLLKEKGVSTPDMVARRIIKQSVDVADIDILISDNREISTANHDDIKASLMRHVAGEPISRIFGETEFWGLPFKVTPDVLDPRPDTETIVDVATKKKIGDPPAQILDMGTGSGCIIITLLKEWPKAKGVASDICKKALGVAGENALRNDVHKRVKFVQSDWGTSIDGKFDLIVSNPPYISNHEIPNLDVSVKNFDPILALSGGDDGLDCYKIIIREIKRLLSPDGFALLEVGFTQAADVSRLVEESGLSVNAVHPDMGGIPRVVEISFGEK